MSVQVEITIAFGAARRHLEINRISNLGLHSTPSDDLSDLVSEYEVILDGGARIDNAIFEHRYGDDVLTLITEAIAALRQNGVERA